MLVEQVPEPLVANERIDRMVEKAIIVKESLP